MAQSILDAACYGIALTDSEATSIFANGKNANGNSVSYTYDPDTEQLSSTTQNGVTVNHSYNADGTPHMTYQNGVAALTYTYSGGQLTQIDRKSFCGGAEQHQYLNMAYNAWGQMRTLKVGTQTLTTNYYDDNGGNLYNTTYGNGQSVEYLYDEFDRLIRASYNTGRHIRYFYNAEGALSRLTYEDGTTPKGSYQFEYDSLGRLIRSAEYDGSGALIQRTEHNYDAYNRLSSQKWMLGSTNYSESYSYSDGSDGDGSLTQMTTGTGYTLNYTYDSLERLQKTQVKDGTTVKFTTAYAYRTISGNQSSTQVEFRNVHAGGDTGTLLEGAKYTYDARGNITTISKSTGSYYPLVAYEYDSQNQLTKETYYDGTGTGLSHITDTYVYTYDTAGNIQTVKKNGITTQTYTYSTGNWKDQLLAVNGNSIVYDNSGNPTTYRNGTGDAYTMQWKNGRQLASVNWLSDQQMAFYSYDADGIRAKKIIETPGECPVSEYVTQNGKVVRETRSDLYDDTNIVLDFIYDESDRPFALIDSEGANDPDPDIYYYILNLQGDVVKLADDEGNIQAVYSYDAWGNILDVTDDEGHPITSQTHIAHMNPLRYRGYYYDRETGWYYLQSRYYDPVIHRFINADSYASTDATDAISCNMFAYCGNNPVTREDESGEFFGLAICIGIGICALIGGVESYASAKTSGASTEEALVQGGIGFLSAGLTATVASIPGIGIPAAMAISGGIGFASSAASEAVHYAYNKDNPDYEFDIRESCGKVLFGTVTNSLSGGLSAGINVVTTGAATQAFVGSVASIAYSGVHFALTKLIEEIF